jgi:hypothetical protein
MAEPQCSQYHFAGLLAHTQPFRGERTLELELGHDLLMPTRVAKTDEWNKSRRRCFVTTYRKVASDMRPLGNNEDLVT